MTTDELIQFCKQKIANVKPKAEEQVFVEIKQALKELKAIKSDKFSEYLLNMGYTKGITDGYNKAIDDFAEVIKANYGFLGYIEEITFEEIDNIAEQLKDGGNDES